MRRLSVMLFVVAVVVQPPTIAHGQTVEGLRECIQGRWTDGDGTTEYRRDGESVTRAPRGFRVQVPWSVDARDRVISERGSLVGFLRITHLNGTMIYRVACNDVEMVSLQVAPAEIAPYAQPRTKRRINPSEYRRRVAQRIAAEQRAAAAQAREQAEREAALQRQREAEEREIAARAPLVARLRALHDAETAPSSETASTSDSIRELTSALGNYLDGGVVSHFISDAVQLPARPRERRLLRSINFEVESPGDVPPFAQEQSGGCWGVWWLSSVDDAHMLHLRTLDACGVSGDFTVVRTPFDMGEHDAMWTLQPASGPTLYLHFEISYEGTL